jgi:hypothetical protein
MTRRGSTKRGNETMYSSFDNDVDIDIHAFVSIPLSILEQRRNGQLIPGVYSGYLLSWRR